MRIIEEKKLDFDDVMIRPTRSTLASRKEVNLVRTFKTKHDDTKIEGIPIIAANMTTGNFTMADELIKHKMFTAIAKHNNHLWIEKLNKILTDQNKEELAHFAGYLKYCFYTIGKCEEDFDSLIQFSEQLQRASNILAWNIHHLFKYPMICIDIANGYSQEFAEYVARVRAKFNWNVIMAGNVCTPEMTQEIILAGADIVKIGIGPGSVCLTRKKTGVGYPQISAAIENADAAHGLGALICLDGGMRTPGDIAKAFGANADFVMLGGMLAGSDECDGEVIVKHIHNGEYYYNKTHVPIIESKQYKIFYGMSSDRAQELHGGGMKDYRTSEGKIEEIECKGPVVNIVNDILGGLRSTGTYIGASSLKQFGKCTTFIKVV